MPSRPINPTSTCVETGGCLGLARTNEGGQEHVGEKARSKSDGTLKKFKDHGDLAGRPSRSR
jgi:hypothetical protein